MVAAFARFYLCVLATEIGVGTQLRPYQAKASMARDLSVPRHAHICKTSIKMHIYKAAISGLDL